MIIIFIVIALITMISIIITIMIGTTATTMSSITTSFWGSQDRSVLFALLFNPRVAMPTTSPRGERTNHGEEIKKTQLLSLLQYAVCNMVTLHAEEGRQTLRDIASALHCSNVGVRLRYEADYGSDDVVGAFQELTAWNDLLTAEQRSRGDHLYQLYSANADERATSSGGTGGTGGAVDPGLRQILATLVDLRDSVFMVPVWEQLPVLGRQRLQMEIRRQGRSVQASWMV